MTIWPFEGLLFCFPSYAFQLIDFSRTSFSGASPQLHGRKKGEEAVAMERQKKKKEEYINELQRRLDETTNANRSLINRLNASESELADSQRSIADLQTTLSHMDLSARNSQNRVGPSQGHTSFRSSSASVPSSSTRKHREHRDQAKSSRGPQREIELRPRGAPASTSPDSGVPGSIRISHSPSRLQVHVDDEEWDVHENSGFKVLDGHGRERKTQHMPRPSEAPLKRADLGEAPVKASSVHRSW